MNKPAVESKEKRDARLVVNAATERVKSAFRDLAYVVAKQLARKPLDQKDEERVAEFALVMADSMTMADVYGRLRTMEELRKLAPHGELGTSSTALTALTLGSSMFHAVFAGADQPDNIAEWLELPFKEAMQSIAAREPMVAAGYVEASEAYARMGFALARKTAASIADELSATEELRDMVAKAIEDGRGPKYIIDNAFELDPKWDENYLRTVAMTNMGSAYTAGRERQMRSPTVAPHIVAHRFVSALLPTTRPNHRAAHGFAAPPDHPVWDTISPLLGYNCYCRKHPVFRAQAQQFGIDLDEHGRMVGNITRPSGAEPDSTSFGRRTDKVVYDGPPGGRAGFRAARPLWCVCGAHVRRRLGV